jgi:heptosyltransferase-2
VVGRGYFDHFLSQDSADFTRWLAADPLKDAGMEKLLADCDAVLSYLPDPTHKFLARYRSSGFSPIYLGPARPQNEHAIDAFARPLHEAGGRLVEPYSRLFLADQDLREAAERWPRRRRRRVAIHPGSGSPKKNWPLSGWRSLLSRLRSEPEIETLVIAGEAEEEALAVLAGEGHEGCGWVSNAPLPLLAGVLAQCDLFVGHDSGPTHVAAAVGTPVLALFGTTEPSVWVPRHPATRFLDACGTWEQLSADRVWNGVKEKLA